MTNGPPRSHVESLPTPEARAAEISRSVMYDAKAILPLVLAYPHRSDDDIRAALRVAYSGCGSADSYLRLTGS